jgi:DNA-binding transcriptional LysR family regulator
MLGTSPSTVSRRVSVLEAALGAPLFLRFPDGYRLTDEGQAWLPRAEAVEAAALAMTNKAAFCASVAGSVRLATAENLATRLLAPHLPGFLARHPNLRLDIVTGVAVVDLGRHEADVALRLTRPERGDLTIRRLGRMACAVYQAKDGSPDAFVGWSPAMAGLPAAQALAAMDAAVAMTSDSLAVHHTLAAAGAARAILPRFMGDADLRLVRGDDVPEAGQDLWLALRTDLAGSVRVRAVADFLAEVVAASAEVLGGRGAEALLEPAAD